MGGTKNAISSRDVDTASIDDRWDDDDATEAMADDDATAVVPHQHDAPDISVHPSTTMPGPPPDEGSGQIAVDASAVSVSPNTSARQVRSRVARAPAAAKRSKHAGDATLVGIPGELDAPASHVDPPADSALGRRVRIAGLVVPLWSPLIATGLIACSLSFVAGTWKGRRERPAPSPAAPAPPPSIEPAATDGSALARIAGQPPDQRSSDDTLALSRGELAQKIAELRELGDRVAADPDVLRDKRTRALLRTRAYEQDTHRDAQAVIAAVPGADSADMLYSVWTGTAARTDATRLAEQLVYSTDVRAKASPSLAVVLDLWRSDKCEAVAALLPRVAAHGDHRSLGRLNLLRPTVGCGDDKKQDCYPCLREGDALDEAIAAASRRAPPTP